MVALHWASIPAHSRWSCADESGCLRDQAQAERRGCWGRGAGRQVPLASPRVVDFADLASVRECPNSFVPPDTWATLEAWEASKATGQPWATGGLADQDALEAQAFVVLEAEAGRIRASLERHRAAAQRH